MTDQPGHEPDQRLPAPRSDLQAVRVDRLSAPPTTRRYGLSGERAAQIVRQSASARWVAFLAVSLVAVFVIAYYFYDLGFPGIAGSSRLVKSQQDQQVTDVEQGYKLFQANCARCHGAQGQGGIGPVINDQMKLLAHFNKQYIRNVLTVGGRYVCGDAKSLMPVWADTGGGPLNYRQIEELIAFLRAPSDLTFQGADPTTGQIVDMKGWRDPNFVAPPNATPVPACWKDAFAQPSPAAGGGASPAPSAGGAGSPAPSGAAASPAPSGGPAQGVVLKLAAQNITYDQASLEAPANTPFQIEFTNNDSGIPHNVSIHRDSATGETLFQGEIFNGVGTKTYAIPALPAGTYAFVCTVHPNMVGTLTVK